MQVVKICKECHKKFIVPSGHPKTVRCSLECRKKYYSKHKKSRKEIWTAYNNKKETKNNKRVWHEHKYFDNNCTLLKTSICENCGTNKSLIIHHKDWNNGRHGLKLNNNKNNLQILCRSCHVKVHPSWLAKRNILKGGGANVK